MSKFTFSFLIVDDQVQDTISYEIEGGYRFEDVIEHICSSFNFNRNEMSIKSSLGFEVSNTKITVKEIVDQYGLYFKLNLGSTIETKGSAHWEQTTITSAPIEEDSVKPGEEEAFNDIMDDLVRIRSESWEVDLEGNAEITIIPNTESLITHLRIRFNLKNSGSEFFTYVAKVLNNNINEILIVVISEKAIIVENYNLPLEKLLDQYGAVYYIYPSNMREEIINQTVVGAEKMKDLIFKYKSHNLDHK